MEQGSSLSDTRCRPHAPISSSCWQRVLVLSHNNRPLLDSFPDTELRNIPCCHREPNPGDTSIVRIESLPRLPKFSTRGLFGKQEGRVDSQRFAHERLQEAPYCTIFARGQVRAVLKTVAAHQGRLFYLASFLRISSGASLCKTCILAI